MYLHAVNGGGSLDSALAIRGVAGAVRFASVCIVKRITTAIALRDIIGEGDRTVIGSPVEVEATILRVKEDVMHREES